MILRWLLLLILVFSARPVNAKVFLIVNDQTNEIYSLSPEDDCVMPESGYTKHVLDMDIKEIELQAHPTDYKYKDKKFVLNVQKVSDKENQKQSKLEKDQELELIDDKARKTALEALISEGKTFKHYKVSDFENN